MIVTSDRVELIQAASLWGGGSPPQTPPLYTGLKTSTVYLHSQVGYTFLETEYRLFPPVTIYLDLFRRAGYFFNASD